MKTQKSKLGAVGVGAWLVSSNFFHVSYLLYSSLSSTQPHNCIANPFVNSNRNMKKYNLYYIRSVLLLVLLLNQHPSKAQQPYLYNKQLDCYEETNITSGFECNAESTCPSYITFRSTPSYYSAASIGSILGVESSVIAEINNITKFQPIPSDTHIIIPVTCSCSGQYYQQNSYYTVQSPSETFFTMANNTYQGLTTCQALQHENPHTSDKSLRVGMSVNVPLRCACPTPNQAASGLKYLLTYMITWGDDFSLIADLFSADVQSILDANELSGDSIIFPFTPLLIPLKSTPNKNQSVFSGNNSCRS